MAEALSTNSKLIVFDSGVNLDDANTNNIKQGATIGDILALSGGGGGGGGGSVPLVVDRPVTDASKAGDKVYWNGEEWIYGTSDWLEQLGILSLAGIGPGYPVPYNFTWNPNRVTQIKKNLLTVENLNNPANYYGFNLSASDAMVAAETTANITWDFLHYPLGARVQQIIINAAKYAGPSGNVFFPFAIDGFEGAELLTDLEDIGTGVAFRVNITGSGGGPSAVTCSAAAIDDFFTKLPSTTKTATLNVSDFTGGSAANASIATAKGYTVIQ